MSRPRKVVRELDNRGNVVERVVHDASAWDRFAAQAKVAGVYASTLLGGIAFARFGGEAGRIAFLIAAGYVAVWGATHMIRYFWQQANSDAREFDDVGFYWLAVIETGLSLLLTVLLWLLSVKVVSNL